MKFVNNEYVQLLGNCIFYIFSFYVSYVLINYKGSVVPKFLATLIGIVWLCVLLFLLFMVISAKFKTNKNN